MKIENYPPISFILGLLVGGLAFINLFFALILGFLFSILLGIFFEKKLKELGYDDYLSLSEEQIKSKVDKLLAKKRIK